MTKSQIDLRSEKKRASYVFHGYEFDDHDYGHPTVLFTLCCSVGGSNNLSVACHETGALGGVPEALRPQPHGAMLQGHHPSEVLVPTL